MNVKCSVLLLSLIPAGGLPQDARLPVPDEAAQQEAEKLIREVFKPEYSKSDPGSKLRLARKLLEHANGTGDDPAVRFVLLREARDLAAQAGEAETAARAADELSDTFQVDKIPMKKVALIAAAKNARLPEELKSAATALQKFAEEAAALDDYDTAIEACKSASASAKQGKELALAGKADARARELLDLKTRFEKVRKARERLSESPDDPAANFALGYFLCVVKGDWQGGLPLLVKGEDTELKALASRDLASPSDPAERAAVADGWWNLAEKEAGSNRQVLRRRAKIWYERALPGLTGLAKAKVEKRLSEVDAAAVPKAKGRWIDMTDPGLFGLSGKAGEPVVVDPGSAGGRVVVLKPFPSGTFDGVSARIRLDSERKANGVLVFESQGRSTCIHGPQESVLADRWENKVWNTETYARIDRKDSYVVTTVIEGSDYVTYVDGEEKLRVKSAAEKITYFALKADVAKVTFDQIRLRKK